MSVKSSSRDIRGVIFDLDGTLADTLPDLVAAVNQALARFDLPARSTTQVRSWIGNGMPMLCRRAMLGTFDVADDAVPAELLARMIEAVSTHYYSHSLDATRPYPGVPELLDVLTSRGLKLGVLSNKPHAHTVPMVQALFGRWRFAGVEGDRDDGRKKPDPHFALSIVQHMGLQPGQVMLVGDSSTDIHTARNAGLIAVAATWGYRDLPELIDARPDHLIDSPPALLPLLNGA